MSDFFKNHTTKLLGFGQVTLGVVVGVSDIIPASHMKYWLLASGLLTAWRGFVNSANADKT